MTKNINTPVNVTAMGFKTNLSAYPKRIEWDGRIYEFVDAGLNLTVRRAGAVCRIVTLSDGLQQFRLRSDRGGSWTLLSIGA